MLLHMENIKGEIPIAFHTGSMAEYHWKDLHRTLEEVSITFFIILKNENIINIPTYEI
jgi:hypothetical protein